MTAHALNLPQRRGACPGLSAPMATGDGLLVRLLPTGTIPLGAFAALCTAAHQHGNGVIEVTSRGSIQIRGLSAASAPRFASAVADLGIAAADGVPVLTAPLAGLDPAELIDAGVLAAAVRHALAHHATARTVSLKISVVIDGDGALGIGNIPADIRLSAATVHGSLVLAVDVGGDDGNAKRIGSIATRDCAAAVTRLLDVLARHGSDRRARDIDPAAFRSAIADLIVSDARTFSMRRSGDAIGLHPLRDGLSAYGVGLAFGHADAASLRRLTEAAVAAGASGLRTVPGRILMILGLTQQTFAAFAAAAAGLDFIVRADDPRRRVVACAGAPICAQAQIASRAIAPAVAAAVALHRDGTSTIHISGCAKGCAHPAAAALTVIGTSAGCALVADGTTRDAPFKVVATDELPAAVAAFGGGLV